MSVLISRANGNLTDAATWALSDPTALLDSESTVQLPQVAAAWSTGAAFTCGAITVDGIALKAIIQLGLVGTVSVRLYNVTAGAAVAGTTVTINVSDLPSCTQAQNNGGWVLFKMAAPVTLLAATSYRVEVQTSNANQMYFYTNGTTGNFSRQLRTTTTQAPVAGDILHVMGEYTGAGTSNVLDLIMNQTATTQYGTGTDGSVALTISSKSSLKYETAAGINYYFKLGGNIIGYNGGRFDIGSTGNEIPRSSTAVLEFNPVADGGMGMIARDGFTFNSAGLSRTAGKDVEMCKLTADVSVGATNISVDTDTGWLAGDAIELGMSTRATGDKTSTMLLSVDAGASSMVLSTTLSNGHLGTAPTQTHIINLTRNVKIRAATSSFATYLNFKAAAIVDLKWTEFYYIGVNSTGRKGIEVETITGSFNMTSCSVHDSRSYAYQTTGATTANISMSHTVFGNCNTQKPNAQPCFFITSTTGLNNNYDHIYCIGGSVSGGNVVWADIGSGVNFSYVVISGTHSGNAIGWRGGTGLFDNIEVYGNDSSAGIYLSNMTSGTLSNIKAWFCQQAGILLNSALNDAKFNNLTLFGNVNCNIYLSTVGVCTFNNLISNSFTGNTTGSGFNIPVSGQVGKVIINNSQMSQVSGSLIAHTQDFNFQGTLNNIDFQFNNCLFGAPSIVAGYKTGIGAFGIVKIKKLNQVKNTHKWYTRYGSAQSTGVGLADTLVRTATSLGLRISPEDSTNGFQWSYKIVAKANSAVYANGFLRKNTLFGTDVAKVELYLPNSTTPDATYTMSNTTDAWEAFAVAANYTGTVDLYATVVITAKTTTAGAYLYVDDLYNGTNKITALDVWEDGMPSPIMFEQLGDAAAVWGVALNAVKTPGTTGKQLNDAFTLPQFIALG